MEAITYYVPLGLALLGVGLGLGSLGTRQGSVLWRVAGLASGVFIGGEFQVHVDTPADGYHDYLEMAADVAGNFLVVWSGTKPGDTWVSVRGRTFDDNIKEEVVQLAPGDRIVVYTDGVIEAMNEAGEEFGLDKLVKLAAGHREAASQDFTNALVQGLEKHRGRAEQSDDITIVTLRLT